MDEIQLITTLDSTARACQETLARFVRQTENSPAGIVSLAEQHGLDSLRALATAEAFGWAAAILRGEEQPPSAAGGSAASPEARLRYILDIAAEKIGESIQRCSSEKISGIPDRIAQAIAAVRFHENLRAWHLLMSTIKLWQSNRL
jgi:hypothetical protein